MAGEKKKKRKRRGKHGGRLFLSLFLFVKAVDVGDGVDRLSSTAFDIFIAFVLPGGEGALSCGVFFIGVAHVNRLHVGSRYRAPLTDNHQGSPHTTSSILRLIEVSTGQKNARQPTSLT